MVVDSVVIPENRLRSSNAWLHVYKFFRLVKMSLGVPQKSVQMIPSKVLALKGQIKILSERLSATVDEMGVECQKAMTAANGNNILATMVTFRLDSFSELLTVTFSKLQDAAQMEKSAEKPQSEVSTVEKSSSLLERIEKLEESSAKYERILVHNQAAQLEAAASTELEKEKLNKLQSRVTATEDLTLQLQTGMCDVQKHLADMTEVKENLATLNFEVAKCCKRSDQLEVKVSSVQTHVDRLTKEESRLDDKLRHTVSKQKSLKQRMDKEEAKSAATSQLIAKKVSNLEKLRNILNEGRSQALGRPHLRQMCEDAKTELQTTKTELQTISSRVAGLDFRIRNPFLPHVGFTAQLQNNREFCKGNNINKMFDVISNVANCFKPHQGHFVAPHDGLYCFSVTLQQESGTCTDFDACIMSKDCNGEAVAEMVIPVDTANPHTSVCVLDLAADRRVFLRITEADRTVTLMNTVAFSGWSIAL